MSSKCLDLLPDDIGQKMNTPTAQELFKAVKYGQKKNARICEFLSEMLDYTDPALQDTVVKVHQDKNKSTREKLCQSIVTLPHELKEQEFVRVGLMSLFLVEEYRFNKVLVNITDKYRQFLGTCTEYRVAVKNFSASWIYQDFPSILRRSRSRQCFPATDLCDLIMTRYNIQSVESKYRLVIAARHELAKLDAQVEEYLSESSINSWRELIHTWAELVETYGAEPLLKAYKGEPRASRPIHGSDDVPSESNPAVCKVEMSSEHKNSIHRPEPECCYEAGPQEVEALIVGQNQHPGDFQSDAQATLPHEVSNQEDVATVTEVTEQTDPDHDHTGVFPQNSQDYNILPATGTELIDDEAADAEVDMILSGGHASFHPDTDIQILSGGHASYEPDTDIQILSGGHASYEPDTDIQILSGGPTFHNNGDTDMEMFSHGDQYGTPAKVPKLDLHSSSVHASIAAEPVYNSFVDDETSKSFNNPGTDAEECSWKGPMESLEREWFRMNATMTTEDEDEIVRQENQRKYYWGDTIEKSDAHVQKNDAAMDHNTSWAKASTTEVPTYIDWTREENHTSWAKASPTDVPTYIDGASGLCMQYQGPAQFTAEPPVYSSIIRVPARRAVELSSPHSSIAVTSEPPVHSSFVRVPARHAVELSSPHSSISVTSEPPVHSSFVRVPARRAVELSSPHSSISVTSEPPVHSSFVRVPARRAVELSSPHSSISVTSEPPVHSSFVRVPARRAVELSSPHSSISVTSEPPVHSSFVRVPARHAVELSSPHSSIAVTSEPPVHSSFMRVPARRAVELSSPHSSISVTSEPPVHSSFVRVPARRAVELSSPHSSISITSEPPVHSSFMRVPARRAVELSSPHSSISITSEPPVHSSFVRVPARRAVELSSPHSSISVTSEPPVHSSFMRVPARRAVEISSPNSSTPIRSCLPPKHRLRYHPYMAGSALRKVASRHTVDQH